MATANAYEVLVPRSPLPCSAAVEETIWYSAPERLPRLEVVTACHASLGAQVVPAPHRQTPNAISFACERVGVRSETGLPDVPTRRAVLSRAGSPAPVTSCNQTWTVEEVAIPQVIVMTDEAVSGAVTRQDAIEDELVVPSSARLSTAHVFPASSLTDVIVLPWIAPASSTSSEPAEIVPVGLRTVVVPCPVSSCAYRSVGALSGISEDPGSGVAADQDAHARFGVDQERRDDVHGGRPRRRRCR